MAPVGRRNGFVRLDGQRVGACETVMTVRGRSVRRWPLARPRAAAPATPTTHSARPPPKPWSTLMLYLET